MTMTLPVKIQMRRGQTALSFASCVAAANGAPSLRNFCREKHVHYHQLVGGSERAFRHLSEYAGISVRDLFAAHPRRIDRMFEIHGERLSYKSFRLRTRVICPKCLLDDADKEPGPPQSRPFGRISWLSTSARVCPLHQLTLVPLDGDIRDFSNDLAALVKYRQPTLLKLARKADAFGSPFDAYVHDRLNGIQTAKCHYLDQFSFHLAAGMTEAVGAQDMFGSSTLFGKLDLRTQIVAANRGFSILSSGNDGLRNHLTTLVNEFWQTDKPRPGTKLYGTLYRYLNGEPDTVAGIPQSVMADHAIQTLPLPTSFYMFGREIERRYLSLLSASAELGFPRGKLKKFLIQLGVLSPQQAVVEDEGRVILVEEEIRPLLKSIATAVRPSVARAYLGMDTLTWEAVISGRILVPLIRRDHQQNVWDQYTERSLKELLSKVSCLPIQDGDPDDLVSLQEAAQQAQCTLAAALGFFLTGKLHSAKRCPLLYGFRSVRIMPRELQSLLPCAVLN